jgi:hypothetical protein
MGALQLVCSAMLLFVLLSANALPAVDVKRSGAATGRSTLMTFPNQNKVRMHTCTRTYT